MGLVVAQAPLDALLPLVDATATTAAAAQAAAAPASGDAFASLLASLSATLDAKATELGAEAAIPGGEAADGDEKKGETDPFAALFAMAMPMTVAKFPAPVELAATGGAEAEPIAGVTEAAGVFAPLLEALPPTEADTQPAAPAGPEAQAAAPDVVPAQADAAPPQPATNVTPQVVPVSMQPTAPAPTDVVEAAAAVGTQPVFKLTPTAEPETEASKPLDVKPADPALADGGTALTEARSVVRTVGNADTNNKDTGIGSFERDKQSVERPQPKASAQGFANAAPNSAVGELRNTQPAATTDAPVALDPAAAPAAPELPQQVEHVARAVIERVEAGGGEAKIHLNPVELGEITIRVHTAGDSVRVEIRAERHEAMSLLRDHTQDLSQLLGDRGLNLSDVNVGLGRGNGGQAWGQEDNQTQRPAAGQFASILGVEDSAPLDLHQRLRSAYNPDGAHVYRV